MSAASIATSVPVPMAMPTSACASAGASLMPSPTIADTLASPAGALRPASALSSGSTSARTRSMPTCAAMASAVRRLSPVSITTSSPIRCSSSIASFELGLDRVGHGDDAGEPAVDGDEHRRLARQRASGCRDRREPVRARRRARASACALPTSNRRARRRVASMPCPAIA